MATIHQIEANRLNAQKSTGPRSATGKATSSRNALKSGIDALSEIIRGEKPEDLDSLTAEYHGRFLPATPEERFFVDTLIRDEWQLRRLAKVDAQIWEFEMCTAIDLVDSSVLGHGFDRGQRPFERLQRRINATERSYKYALRELLLLQSTRAPQPDPEPAPQPQDAAPPSPAIGFVPPKSPKPQPTAIGFVPPKPPQPQPNPVAVVPSGLVPPPLPSAAPETG